MPLVFPNIGKPRLLQFVLQRNAGGIPDWELLLWINNIVPNEDSVIEDLTEATFTGYSRETLTRAAWTNPVIVANKAVSTWGTTPIVWTDTAGVETVFGYAAVDPTDNVLIMLERFAFPVAMVVGAIVGVLPRVTLKTE
jgi:hypothetical protein